MKKKELKGKEIKSVEKRSVGNNECVVLRFTDGTKYKITSWDYEGYSSGLTEGF